LQIGRQLRAKFVVDVDHRRAQARPGEQAALGGAVVGHAAVVVKMVSREIGEQRHVNARGVQALLDDADGRGFQRTGRKAEIDKTAKSLVQRDGVGRGQAGAFHRFGFTHAQRADDTAAPAQACQRLRHPPRRAGFAIGAGGGHHIENRTGLGQAKVGNVAGGGFQPGQRGDAFVAEPAGCHALGFHQASGSAASECGGHEVAAIGGLPRPRDEGITRLQRAAVAAQPAPVAQRHARGQPGGCFLGCGQGRDHAQKLSVSPGTGLALICAFTSMSGATFIMRSVCCTTWLNTGAATSPPK